MHISLQWLKDYLNLPGNLDPKHLQEIVTTSMAEIEGFHSTGQEGVVVAKVLKIEPHPNADRLKLAVIDTGKEKMKVVCGGVNLAEGMLVIYAHEGCKVRWHGEEKWTALEKANIRGVESSGMICASEELELALPCPEKGITDLGSVATEKDIGKNLFDVLNLRDVIFEIDNKSLTNRPDLLGHYGVARDTYAILKNQEKLALTLKAYPQSKLPTSKEKLAIKIESKNCRRYSGVRVSNVAVGKSPEWLQERLVKVGVRPINNLVDITNYVMFDLGQPMHVFDRAKVAGDKILVRQAKKGESLLALDGKKYELNADDLIIADSEKPIGLGGVMGGEYSGVTDATTDIIFEAANFEPATIRKTAQRLSLRSESSGRFEKNIDPENTLLALNRAVALLLELCPEAKVSSAIFDSYPVKIKPKTITFRKDRLEKKVGVSVSLPKMKNILTDLGCKVVQTSPVTLKVTPPSWRATKDITHEDDLIEEVARVYGYKNIPLTAPEGVLMPTVNPQKKFERKVREICSHSLQLNEVMNYPFTNLKLQEKFGLPADNLLQVQNPIAADHTHLKTHLLPDLLEDGKENIHQTVEFGLFELGRVYRLVGKNTQEKKEIAGLWVEPKRKRNSSLEDPFFTVKQKLESLFTLLGAAPRTYESRDALGRSADITIGGMLIGHLGHIEEKYKKDYDLERSEVVFWLLDHQLLLESCATTLLYTPLPKFPAVVRDISVIIDKSMPASVVESTIKKAHKDIATVELFDVYENEKLGNDKRSLTYNITYVHPEKTLNEKEIEEISKKIVTDLEKMGAKIRTT